MLHIQSARITTEGPIKRRLTDQHHHTSTGRSLERVNQREVHVVLRDFAESRSVMYCVLVNIIWINNAKSRNTLDSCKTLDCTDWFPFHRRHSPAGCLVQREPACGDANTRLGAHEGQHRLLLCLCFHFQLCPSTPLKLLLAPSTAPC